MRLVEIRVVVEVPDDYGKDLSFVCGVIEDLIHNDEELQSIPITVGSSDWEEVS